MNVFDNVFIYVTDEGEEGIIRADNKEEALEKVSDYEGPFVKIKTIKCLALHGKQHGD